MGQMQTDIFVSRFNLTQKHKHMQETDITMEHSVCHLNDINRDLLADILGRVDGSALASVACTCSDLRIMAGEESLWKALCQSKWPSTALEEAEHLISSSAVGGFDKFYADSYPFIFYDSCKELKLPKPESSSSPSDFVSLVDVYCKDRCIFSKVLDGIPEAVDMFKHIDSNQYFAASDCERWFLENPFKMEILEFNYDEDDDYVDDDDDDDDDDDLDYDDEMLATPAMLESQYKEIIDNIRLSWVLLNKKLGKAVNLSSWKPLLVQRNWPNCGDYVMHFGCVIPLEESVLPHKLTRCIIATKIRTQKGDTRPQLREISLSIEKMTGAHVNGKMALTVLNQALYSSRSTNQLKVEESFHQYDKQKREIISKQDIQETLSNTLCISIEILVFATFCFAFSSLF